MKNIIYICFEENLYLIKEISRIGNSTRSRLLFITDCRNFTIKDNITFVIQCTECEKKSKPMTYRGFTKSKNKKYLCSVCCKKGERNPFYNKIHSQGTIEKIKQKNKIISENLWKNEEYRKHVIEGLTGVDYNPENYKENRNRNKPIGIKKRTEQFKIDQSIRIKQWYDDNPEQRIIRSNNMIESWKNGKIIPNVSPSTNESKIERDFFNEIQKLYQDTIVKKSIKAGNTWITPDIIIPDICVIYEFFGDYWHANPSFYLENDIVHHNLTAKEIWEKDKKRIYKLEELGYSVEIIWEYDYKHYKQKVLNKVRDYILWDSCSL